MQTAETVLALYQDRGRRGLPLEDIYRQLFNRDHYLRAYGRIYRNAGAMTPGTTPETVDAMSLEKIDKIIDALRREVYRWTQDPEDVHPERNGKLRPSHPDMPFILHSFTCGLRLEPAWQAGSVDSGTFPDSSSREVGARIPAYPAAAFIPTTASPATPNRLFNCAVTSGSPGPTHAPRVVARIPSRRPFLHHSAMVDTVTFRAVAASGRESRPATDRPAAALPPRAAPVPAARTGCDP